MAIPEHVKRQREEGDRALAAAMGEQTEQPVATPAPDQQPVVAAAPQPSPAPAEAPLTREQQLETELREARQHLSTLKGKYDAEVSKINEKERLRNEEQARASSAAAAVDTGNETDELAYVKKEELEAYDKDSLDLHRRIARGVAERESKKRDRELAQLKSQIAAMQDESRSAKAEKAAAQAGSTVQQIETLSPGFSEDQAGADADPQNHGWARFLRLPNKANPAKTNKDLGEIAMGAGDIERVAQLHRSYRIMAGLSPEQNLDSQVRPSNARAGAANPVNAGQKPVIRERDVAEFLDPNKRRHMGLSAEQINAKMSEIEAAIADGRFVP